MHRGGDERRRGGEGRGWGMGGRDVVVVIIVDFIPLFYS